MKLLPAWKWLELAELGDQQAREFVSMWSPAATADARGILDLVQLAQRTAAEQSGRAFND